MFRWWWAGGGHSFYSLEGLLGTKVAIIYDQLFRFSWYPFYAHMWGRIIPKNGLDVFAGKERCLTLTPAWSGS